MNRQKTKRLTGSAVLSLVTVVSLLFATTSVQAHQGNAALTTVLFNPRSNNIEVMHRFSLHDAEHAVKHIFSKDADIIATEKTQQRFNQYVNQHFSMWDEQGEELKLSAVGYEVEGKHFWVYQETGQPVELSNLTIRHDALRELWPKQVNTINVEGKGKLQTLTFEDSIELLTVEF